MKKALLCHIILFLAGQAYAQAYQPIPTDSVYWVELETGPDGGSCDYYTYRYVYPVGNVIIQGNNYTEYRANGITEYVPMVPPYICPSNQTFTNQFYAFIRNDSVNKKVYVYDTVNLHQDICIYDFAITNGDTVNPTSAICACSTVCPFDTFVVGNADSINLGGTFLGTYQIIKVTDPLADTVLFIQGIGSNFGLAYNYYCPVEISTKLVCYHYKNNEYITPQYVGSPYCTTTLSVDQEIPSSQTILSQNINNQFYVNNDQHNSIQIQCFNAIGQMVTQQTYNQSGFLNLNSLPSGIYYISINFNGQMLNPYKFYVSN